MILRKSPRLLTALAFSLLATLNLAFVRADDPPASRPSNPQYGTVIVNVVDSDGKPAVGVTVRLVPLNGHRHKAPANDPNPPPNNTVNPYKQHKWSQSAIQSQTDSDGKVTFTNVPVGRYAAIARDPNLGRGHAMVQLAPGSDGTISASATITLSSAPQQQPGGGSGSGGSGQNPPPKNPPEQNSPNEGSGS